MTKRTGNMSKETAAKSDSWHGRPDSATESNVSEARECKVSRLTWIYLRIQAKLGSWTYPDLSQRNDQHEKPVETNPEQYACVS